MAKTRDVPEATFGLYAVHHYPAEGGYCVRFTPTGAPVDKSIKTRAQADALAAFLHDALDDLGSTLSPGRAPGFGLLVTQATARRAYHAGNAVGWCLFAQGLEPVVANCREYGAYFGSVQALVDAASRLPRGKYLALRAVHDGQDIIDVLPFVTQEIVVE